MGMTGDDALALAKAYVKSSMLGAGAVQGKDGKNGKDGKSAYEIAVENGFLGTQSDWLDSLKGKDGQGGTGTMPTDAEDRIKTLEKQIEELLYIPINITSFSVNPSISEIGSTVNVNLAWKVNKDAKTLTLDGLDVKGTESKTVSGVNANKSWTLIATDDKNTSSKTTNIRFMNGVYHGVSNKTTLDNVDILSMTKTLQVGKAKTFSVNIPNGSYGFYCLPSSYGKPSYKVGGFDGGFSKVQTIPFTNASGHTENYDIWRTDNTNLGSISVQVS